MHVGLAFLKHLIIEKKQMFLVFTCMLVTRPPSLSALLEILIGAAALSEITVFHGPLPDVATDGRPGLRLAPEIPCRSSDKNGSGVARRLPLLLEPNGDDL